MISFTLFGATLSCASAFAYLSAACSGITADPEPLDPSAPQRLAPVVYETNHVVRRALLHSDGSMWFATNHEGAYRFVDGEFTQFTDSDGLPSNYVSTLTEDHAGHVWFGTDRGLCQFDGERFTPVPIPWDGKEDLWGPGLNANLVLCLHCDSQGKIWLGTWGNGAHRFDPAKPIAPGRYAFESFLQERGTTYQGGSHRNAIQSIVEDREGNVWLTSMSHGGLTKFDGRDFRHYQKESGLSDDMVFSAHFDRAGTLWLGMLGNSNDGLNEFDGDSFVHYGTADGLSSDNLVCIFEDASGALWLGSDRGELCQLTRDPEKGVLIAPLQIDGRTFEHIHFVTEDAAGGVWFGGRSGQLYRYDGTTLTDLSSKR